MIIFEDKKYEPNITNDETNNVSDCGEFEDEFIGLCRNA